MEQAAKAQEHLILRQWRDSDLEPFAEMNADAEVMRYFPSILSRAESEAAMERYRRAIDERGWGLWAVEVDGALQDLPDSMFQAL